MVRRSSQTGIEQSLALAPTGVKAAVTHIDKIRQGREVSIEIHHHYASKVFHPGSVVSGDLIITPLRDIKDVSMQISLIGRSRVHREDVQGRQTTTHNFLGLDMPIPPSAYPPSGNMQKGETYRIPFNFTVPSQLLPSACRRRSEFDGISDYHLQLPPSVGGWEKDDLAPELSRITYAITASVHQGDSLKKVLEISKTIKMLGSSREDPPLSITKNDENYKLKKTKKVRNGLLSKAVGRITAMADQPTAFYLYSDGREASQSEANVNLFFEGPSSKIAPPEVEAVSAKIRAYTWYSSTPMQTLPNFGNGRGAFSMTVPVTAERIETPWVSNLDKLGELRDVKQTAATQTKAVNVRFSLPVSKKTFLPTFHSCLISRAYVMELKLKVGGQNMTLSLPVQIVTGDCVVAKDELDILPQFEDL